MEIFIGIRKQAWGKTKIPFKQCKIYKTVAGLCLKNNVNEKIFKND